MGDYSNSSYGITPKGRKEHLRQQLEVDRANFMLLWRDLSDYILPWRRRFLFGDRNKDRRSLQIVDNTATLAARNFANGIMASGSSAATPWFRLTLEDPDLAESRNVKEWLHRVTDLIRLYFSKSNAYLALAVHYEDMGVFCTAAMLALDDDHDVKRFYPMPIGSYSLGAGARGIVEVMTRSTTMTVRQIVERFGTENGESDEDKWGGITMETRNSWDRGDYEKAVEVIHVIDPNKEYDKTKLHSKHKKFSECYYEFGSKPDQYLDERGYDLFPVLATRVKNNGEDVYGTGGPGIDCLGDVKSLQLLQKRKSQAIAKQVDPPLVGPESLRGKESNLLPGGKTYLDVREQAMGFKPVYQVQFDIAGVMGDIEEHRQRINSAFMNDIFLMLASSERGKITAREVEELHGEKYSMVGSTLERLNDDLYEPLIDVMFDGLLNRGLIPPPPPEIQGMPLKVEYLSIMAQAQKSVGTVGLERLVGFMGMIAAQSGNPGVFNKLNPYKAAGEYADLIGVVPHVTRTDEEVAAIDQAQQQAQQAAQQQQQVMAAAEAAKTASQADMSGDTALSRMANAARGQQQ